MQNPRSTQTWPELAIGLYDQLTERNSEISYEMNDLAVQVPDGAGPDATSAKWVLNGTMRIRTRNDKPELLDVTFSVSSFEAV